MKMKTINKKFRHIELKRASDFKKYAPILMKKLWHNVELTDRVGNTRLIVRNEREEYKFDTNAVISLVYGDVEFADGFIYTPDKKVRITKIKIDDKSYLPDDETFAIFYVAPAEVHA
jgi:hypothetical protein